MNLNDIMDSENKLPNALIQNSALTVAKLEIVCTFRCTLICSTSLLLHFIWKVLHSQAQAFWHIAIILLILYEIPISHIPVALLIILLVSVFLLDENIWSSHHPKGRLVAEESVEPLPQSTQWLHIACHFLIKRWASICVAQICLSIRKSRAIPLGFWIWHHSHLVRPREIAQWGTLWRFLWAHKAGQEVLFDILLVTGKGLLSI